MTPLLASVAGEPLPLEQQTTVSHAKKDKPNATDEDHTVHPAWTKAKIALATRPN